MRVGCYTDGSVVAGAAPGAESVGRVSCYGGGE